MAKRIVESPQAMKALVGQELGVSDWLVMTQERIRHLPVVEGAQLVGILTAGDIMATAVRERNVEIQYLQDYLYGGSTAG